MLETIAKIEIGVPGCREKFAKYITERGGIKIWRNINLSNPDAGDIYTPVRDSEGNDYPKPHWSVEFSRIVTDINAFRFIKELREVKRFHVAIRRSSNGLMFKCTDASSAKLRKAMSKIQEQTGEKPCYRFDYETQEAVIEMPVWED